VSPPPGESPSQKVPGPQDVPETREPVAEEERVEVNNVVGGFVVLIDVDPLAG
jgi:hypothetical protein